jgi:predicted regulator of Ras-like GTPase activity (Roadblock/LC7/MglB family)
MTGNTPTTSGQALDWLLGQFVQTTSGILSAVLASGDGVLRAADGLDNAQAERLSATVSGLFSLSKGISDAGELDTGGVRQTIIEYEHALLFVSQAAERSLLAVTARQGSDVGQIGFAIKRLITQVAPHLATPGRGTSSPESAQ